MSNLVKIATVHDIPADEVRAFHYDGRQIAIYNVGGQLYATDNICSHAYAELHEGYLDTDDCTIECPLHGSRFDLRSGAVLSLPAYEPIATYAVRVEGQDVLVEL
jgi:3-phenylpropionate/trans-cinnamate dioxygenase ferredoxin subunit